MPERTPYIAANWKMHKTVAEAAEYVDALLPRIAATPHDVVICPSFLALSEVVERSRGSAVKVVVSSGPATATTPAQSVVVAQVAGDIEDRAQFALERERLADESLAAGVMNAGRQRRERAFGAVERGRRMEPGSHRASLATPYPSNPATAARSSSSSLSVAFILSREKSSISTPCTSLYSPSSVVTGTP